MNFNIYSAWMDPVFYMFAVVFALALFFLLFSIRKYLGILNKSDFDEPNEEAGEVQGELPLAEAAPEDPEPQPASETLSVQAEDASAVEPAPDAPELPASRTTSRAEEFVKGLYDHLASLDGRVKNIEADLTKSRVNRDYAAKFLEDMVSDFESLDKTKIKARIEYLLADLKK